MPVAPQDCRCSSKAAVRSVFAALLAGSQDDDTAIQSFNRRWRVPHPESRGLIL